MYPYGDHCRDQDFNPVIPRAKRGKIVVGFFVFCFVVFFLIGQWYFKCKITSREIQRELYYLKFLLIF